MDTAITSTQQTSIKPWGTRDEVRELTERLRLMLPNANKLTANEVRALAQGAVAHGLDPLNGEIWFLKARDGTPRGLMIGVKGLRKKAHEQVKGNFWIDFREIIVKEELQRLRIPEGSLAFEARLFDSENIRTYADTVERLTKAGIPWDAVKEMVGGKPYTTGIGVLKPSEPTMMEPAQCAMKRAEADAIKRRFDVPFGLAISADLDEAPYNGEWSDAIDGEVMEHDATDDEMTQRLSVPCACGHTIEEHGVKGACEVAGCQCRKYADSRLERGKRALGRDGGGID